MVQDEDDPLATDGNSSYSCMAAAQPFPHRHLPLQGFHKEAYTCSQGMLIDKIPLNSASLQQSTDRAPNYHEVYILA